MANLLKCSLSILFLLSIFAFTDPFTTQLYLNIFYGVFITVGTVSLVWAIFAFKKFYTLKIGEKLLIFFLLLFSFNSITVSVEYLIYINDKEVITFDKEVNKPELDDINSKIEIYHKHISRYERLSDSIISDEYYPVTEDLNIIVGGDTLILTYYNNNGTHPYGLPPGITNEHTRIGRPAGVRDNSERLFISFKDGENYNRLKSIDDPNFLSGEFIKETINEHINSFQRGIELKKNQYTYIQERGVSFANFIFSVFISTDAGLRDKIIILLIFLQLLINTFFIGYIYRLIYRKLDGDN